MRGVSSDDGKITLGAALAELGFIPGAFVFLAGAPSIVSILQSVFVERDLYGPFRELFSLYDGAVSTVKSLLSPVGQSIIDICKTVFEIEISLSDYWPQVWGLFLVFVIPNIKNRITKKGILSSILPSFAEVAIAASMAIIISSLVSSSAGIGVTEVLVYLVLLFFVPIFALGTIRMLASERRTEEKLSAVFGLPVGGFILMLPIFFFLSLTEAVLAGLTSGIEQVLVLTILFSQTVFGVLAFAAIFFTENSRSVFESNDRSFVLNLVGANLGAALILVLAVVFD